MHRRGYALVALGVLGSIGAGVLAFQQRRRGGSQQLPERAELEGTFADSHGRWDILPGESLDDSGKRDKVAEGSMESFPASDPPSYMG